MRRFRSGNLITQEQKRMNDNLEKENTTATTEEQQEQQDQVPQEQEEKKEPQQSAEEADTQKVDEAEAQLSSVDIDSDKVETADSIEPNFDENEGIEANEQEDITADAPEDVATFTGDAEGKVYTFDELEAASDDYTDDEFHQLVDMYEGTLTDIDEKEIVTGRVVSVDEKYVVVDIGFKSEGIVQANEFSNEVLENLNPGDEIDVFLDRVEDREGQLILSRRKADILHAWDKIEEHYENESIIEGYIKRRIKGGMVVDIMGIDAFLPGSQIDVRPVRDFDAYVDKTMEFKVVKLNLNAENVVVSHRALIESDLEEQREEILETIETGQVLEGIVKNITDFGVFIDLGGVDGLLHITDLSWGRVEHPSEIVNLDQKMNVAVIDFDDETKRVSLGLKQLQPHPWNNIHDKYPENTKVQGRVVSIADYGAFIELEKGVEGLIHISEMSWTQHIKHPSQLVEKDDIIECVILNVNEEERKISIGVKQLEKDPWEDLSERYPVGSKHKGTVRNLTNFGVFVELEPGIDGLVHISDLSWTDKITHPSEVIEQDDELEVVILGIDFDNRRITLGHKQIEENPWEEYAEQYNVGSDVKGTAEKITDRGIFVKLPLGATAFLPGAKMDIEGDFEEEVSVGDELEGFVTDFDESSKSITLSQKENDRRSLKKKKESKKKAKQTKEEKPETGAPTLGEVSGLGALKKKLEEEGVKKKQDDE